MMARWFTIAMAAVRRLENRFWLVYDTLMTNIALRFKRGLIAVGKKREKVYVALLDGATAGHSGKQLHDFVEKRFPKTSSKRIVRASLLALTDPHLMDRNILDTIYALAINERLGDVGRDDNHDNQAALPAPEPSAAIKVRKPKAAPAELSAASEI
jgi:hypothetical protein